MAEKRNPEPTNEKIMRLVWGNTDETPVQYANQMAVSYAGGSEFHITFGHLLPPIGAMDVSELPDNLTIKPIITIVASPDVMRSFVKVLVENLEGFEKDIKERGAK